MSPCTTTTSSQEKPFRPPPIQQARRLGRTMAWVADTGRRRPESLFPRRDIKVARCAGCRNTLRSVDRPFCELLRVDGPFCIEGVGRASECGWPLLRRLATPGLASSPSGKDLPGGDPADLLTVDHDRHLVARVIHSRSLISTRSDRTGVRLDHIVNQVDDPVPRNPAPRV